MVSIETGGPGVPPDPPRSAVSFVRRDPRGGGLADAARKFDGKQGLAGASERVGRGVPTAPPACRTTKAGPHEGPAFDAIDDYDFESQKIFATSSTASRSFWPWAGSFDFLESPASFVAFQNSSWRSEYFSRCSGLK
jgi:hypothetical protein